MCLGVNLVLILDVFFLKYLINVFFYDFNVVMLKINIFFKSYFNLISSKKQSRKAPKNTRRKKLSQQDLILRS
jgi:hypothetical protein